MAVEPEHLDSLGPVIDSQFNRLAAMNAMKFSELQPEEGHYDFGDADTIADHARDRGIVMTGHTLVWHKQVPSWLFDDLVPGDPGDIETLRGRMQSHIEKVIEEYQDVVDNWDVVNEAISADNPGEYRKGTDTIEPSQWYEYYGNEEYIFDAFKFARDTLEKRAGGSQGRLYYNDFNVTLKVDKILQMLAWLENHRDERGEDNGIKIDGVGLQAHWRLDWPSIEEIEETIQQIVTAGYKVKISELDISVYNDYAAALYQPESQKSFTPELEAQQAERYKDLFALFREYSAHITSVTLWGVSDDCSWLNDHPVVGRPDYPLLYDRSHLPKEALGAILDF